ncbi:FliH/SctL family protein [Pseudodonghicola flavimaris]|uniref:FliH/SctL family protein n=1 Tax=Pseudodonghicola flavimaris TaxID=3050036 RepID=A0ABT7EWN9_9RHOB|nr:FliH/SctL family protein [Pseudodonghicola flavimaris]MDK3016700.1 FliH/SctL family protein [Pseudodonghicola flavimaris]
MMTRLFLRDFDAEDAELGAEPVMPAQQPEGLRNFSAAEVEQMLAEARETAWTRGHEEGAAAARAEAETGQSARAAAALEALQGQITDLSAELAAGRAALERDLLDMVLDMAERIAPELLADLSVDLARSRLREGLRMAMGSRRLRIGLSPAVAEALAPEIAAWAEEGATPELDLRPDPALPDGAARIGWDDGGLSYNLDRSCAAVLDALREAAGKLKHDQEKVG